MKDDYQIFTELLEQEDKAGAVRFALGLLDSHQLDAVTLYTHVLAPSLNGMECTQPDRRVCVWREHVRTAIVRTIVECCYPYILAERNSKAIASLGKAVVICPPGEYHDLGARMAADFFTLCGYESIFVGSNTPVEDIVGVTEMITPRIIAISVSNYYNLIATRLIISRLRENPAANFHIVVGGNAFSSHIENVELVGADEYANTFEDIARIASGEATSC